MKCRALLDNCSQASYISKKLVETLKLKTKFYEENLVIKQQPNYEVALLNLPDYRNGTTA